jgi:hypothetical protein
MTPVQFKTRYLDSQPTLPPGIDLGLDEFVVFPESEVEPLRISADDKEFLTVSGLPKSAAPFLSFGPSGKIFLRRMSELGLSDDFRRYRVIGFNSCGDVICIDEEADGMVIYLNHDLNIKIVFVNSSVGRLSSCLCVYAEFIKDRDGGRCAAAIRQIDPGAMDEGAFWRAVCRFNNVDLVTECRF